MSPAEWDGLAWWQQMMYLDGFEWEGIVTRSDGDDPRGEVTAVHQSGGTTITERRASATFSGEPGEMEAFGIRTRKLG